MTNNKQTRELLVHNSQNIFYRHPFGAVPTGAVMRFRIAVHYSCKTDNVIMRLWSNGIETLLQMERVATGGDPLLHTDSAPAWCGNIGADSDTADYDIYQAVYTVTGAPRLIWYYFILPDACGERLYYGNNPEMLGGVGVGTPGPPWSYQITVYDAAYSVPEWLRHGIIYQIFPDRFYQKRDTPLTQEEAEKKRPDYIVHANWNETPLFGPDPRTGEIMNNDFFGGNLAGIEAKLPYLKELGINIIYLNPIFEAYSNHRYDTGDYMKIDPLLGSEEDFTSLCEKAKRQGIRIILDGVFNHTGSDSRYFNKDGWYEGVGAFQSESSDYYDWYTFEKYPTKYKCWWGILTLPGVNLSNADYTKYIVSGSESVVKRWLRRGAAGWRLDVVDELPGAFVKELRRHIKAADADAVILGEVWEDASNKLSYGQLREYLQGYELDSVMNYVFKNALIAYIMGKTSAARFNAEIWKIAENYPMESYFSLMNLIGGHDVPRILTILSEPPENLTREQKAIHKPTMQKHKTGIKRLKLMSLIQMTFPGTPAVYYGDEAGMTGFEDPFNRGPYPWDDANPEIRGWYKKIIALRNSFDPLRTGSFTTVYADGPVYAFIREIKGGADAFGAPARDGFALIAVNRDKNEAKTIGIDIGKWRVPELYDAFDGNARYCADAGGILNLTVGPLGSIVLLNTADR